MVRFAWVTLGINVVVILLGALVRATGSGAGCGESWPTCDGQIVPAVLEGARAVEFTHRVASGVAIVAVGVLAVWVFRAFGRGHLARKAAVVSVVAIIGEALIGAWLVLAALVGSDDSVARSVSVPLHLVNTLLLLAALTLTAFWASGGGPIRPATDRGFAVWAVVITAGTVLVSATGAVTALADTLFPKDAVGFAIGDLASSEHLLTRLQDHPPHRSHRPRSWGRPHGPPALVGGRQHLPGRKAARGAGGSPTGGRSGQRAPLHPGLDATRPPAAGRRHLGGFRLVHRRWVAGCFGGARSAQLGPKRGRVGDGGLTDEPLAHIGERFAVVPPVGEEWYLVDAGSFGGPCQEDTGAEPLPHHLG